MEYLDFELPIKELEEQLHKCELIAEESDVDMTESCKNIEKKLQKTKNILTSSTKLNIDLNEPLNCCNIS